MGTTYTLFDYSGTLTGGISGLTLNTSALPTTGLNAYYTYALSTATAGQINIVPVRAAATFTWSWGDRLTLPDPNGTWTDPVNWVSNNGLIPFSTDSVVFNGTARRCQTPIRRRLQTWSQSRVLSPLPTSPSPRPTTTSTPSSARARSTSPETST